MVQSGQAFVYRQYLGRCDRGAYLAAERQAQAQRLGVWAVPGGLRGPGISGMGERATATEGRSQPGHPQARPSLALKLPSPAGPRPPASRSAPLPGPRSCCGRGTAISIAMGMGWLVRGCVSSYGGLEGSNQLDRRLASCCLLNGVVGWEHAVELDCKTTSSVALAGSRVARVAGISWFGWPAARLLVGQGFESGDGGFWVNASALGGGVAHWAALAPA